MADADQKRSSWRKSLRLASLKGALKRLSSRPRTDDLSNEIVRYQGISVSILADIRDRVLRGEAAKGVELLVAEGELAEGVMPGHTLLRTGDGKGIAAYRDGELSFRPEQVQAKLREDWTVEDVCTRVVLPLTLPTRCFFLDLLEPKDVGKPFEGAFVSQCRQYRFTDLVDTLLESGKEFVWFDVFCANQPLLTDKNAPLEVRTQYWDVLNKGFHQAIARFDSVLLAFDSWQAPTPLTRAWCVWEMYGAALSGNDLRIVFAGSEAASVEQWLRTYIVDGKTSFLRVLADMDPRAMQCHDPNDLEMIRSAVEAMNGGFPRLKQMVTERLTRWLLSAVEDCVKRNAEEAHLDKAFAGLLHNAATVIYDTGHLEVALSYYRKALAIYKQTLGERHLVVGNALNDMAVVYETLGKLDLALEALKEALAIKKEKLGRRDPSVARTLSNMAAVYRSQGKLDLALETYEEALAMNKKALGEQHLSVADTLGNMGLVYEEQGMLELALGAYEQALAIKKETLGERHLSVAATLGGMALVYTAQGELDLALHLSKEALAIFKETLGERHSSVAQMLNNMARVYEEQGELDQALDLYKDALAIKKEALGERHFSVALTLENMARVYEEQDELDLALETYEEALVIKKETLGERHVSVADALFDMAVLFEEQEQFSDARRCALEALEIYREVYGEMHEDTLECVDFVAGLQ